MATKASAEAESDHGGVAAVDRALGLLKAFRLGDESLGLAQLAERTGMYKSTILRLLESLEHAHMIERLEDGRYALGHEVGRLHLIYQASYSLERVVMPVLKQLVKETGESAALHVRRGDSRLCYFRVDSPHPIRDHIQAGDLLPLNRGTGGRVLTAYDPVAGKAAGPDKVLYASIRANGYYAAVGDRLAEVAGVSAPVFGRDGRIAAALTLTCPAHRYQEQFIAAVLAASRLLTGQIDALSGSLE